jgi:hypothetical protein
MGNIWLWTENEGPYKAKGNGIFVINGGDKVKSSSGKPAGFKTTISGYFGKSGDNFEQGLGQRIFRPTKYWGLIHNTNKDIWTKVQLWEYYDSGAFVGMPRKRDTLPPNPRAMTAAYFAGDYVNKNRISSNPNSPKAGPVFRFYARGSKDYYAILDDREIGPFKDSNQTPNSNTPPVGGGRGNNPGWDGRDGRDGSNTNPGSPDDAVDRILGPGSGSGTTIGNQPPSGGDLQDAAWWQGYPTPPKTIGSKPPGGKWVVGADGKRYYLPPGLDFSGFKQPPPAPKPETKIVVRMPKGYAPPFSTAGTKPRMTQRQLDLTDSGQVIGTVTDTFIFPYIPQNIRYSDIGSAWQEVPRAMNTSFVDWSGYKLMKVSMDFLVSAQYIPSIKNANGTIIVQGTAVSDGLMNSVTNELNMLRRMATNKFPVTLEGFDDILQIQMARSRFEQPRGLQFVIQDLNITAGRRTIDETTGLATTPSLISAAQVSITLQEIPVETVTIVKLPPLELGTPVVGKGGGGGGGGVVTLGLQSELLTGLKWEIPAPVDPNG